MKILSLNANGLKAFYNRGEGEGLLLQSLLDLESPDVILFQETKCSEADFWYWLNEWENDYKLKGFANEFKKGYAGVGAMYKGDPIVSSKILIDSEYDSGRIIQLEYPDIIIIGVYVLNSGDKDELREEWNLKFSEYLTELKERKPIIVIGDFNVCSTPDDCYAFSQFFDWMPGVKDYEMKHFSSLLRDNDLIDTYRYLHPNTIKYSWFSYRGNSRYANKGFRLDYSLISSSLRDKLVRSEILGKPCEYSDHNPLLLEIN